MKQKSIISITLTNGLFLLMFGSFLASCQKKEIQSKGLFTHYTIASPKRAIASINGINFKFNPQNLNSFQDTKQIYVYCSLSSPNIEMCFKKYLDATITVYKDKFGPFKDHEIKLLKQAHSFEEIKHSIDELTVHLLKDLEPDMNHFVNTRESFCLKNSKFYLKRCLNQYIEKDSFHVLNSFQKKYPSINGPEYLFLKKKISHALKRQLESSFDKIKSL